MRVLRFLLSDCAGLAWAGLCWPGLARAGLAWLGLAWAGLGWPGLCWVGLAWAGLAWPGLACPMYVQRGRPFSWLRSLKGETMWNFCCHGLEK